MRIEIGRPGFSSPSTRCSLRIWRVRLSGTGPAPFATASRSEPTLRLRHYAPVGRRGGGGVSDRTLTSLDPGLHLEVGADRRVGSERDLEGLRPRAKPTGERHGLAQRRTHYAFVRIATIGPLVILLDETAPRHRVRTDLIDLEQQSEQVGAAAPEAQLVGHERTWMPPSRPRHCAAT